MRAFNAVSKVASQAVYNANLPRNAAKGSWATMSRRRLYWLLLVEVWELGAALWALSRAERAWHEYERSTFNHGCDSEEYHAATEAAWAPVKKARQHVEHEAGDCVAFLAFLVD